MATRKTILAVAFALAACSRGADRKSNGGGDDTAPSVVRAAEPLPNQYLVVLKPGSESVASVAGSLMDGEEGAWPLRYYERALRGFALHANETTALAIAADPRVAWVAEDGRARTQALVTQPSAPEGLDRIDQRIGLNGTYAYHDGAGEGVHAYVVDTGIEAAHVQFAGREPDEQNFVDDGNTGDCNGHGTHVAGILGGSTYGVAKKVSLHSLRVLGCDGAGATSDVVAALDWLITNAQRPAVANLSLGRDPDAALDAAVEAVIASGIPVVVAAGDRGRDACARSPARVAGGLTVASTVTTVATEGDLSGLAAASFSNQGPCVDLFAPGVDIRSASIAASEDDSPEYAGSVLQSGTSTSAPFVAGAVALFLGRNPAATPDAVTRALVASSTRAPAVLDRYTPDRFLFTRFVEDDNSADAEPPAAAIDEPLPGALVSGADVAVTATTSDDVEVTRAELFANGRFIASSLISPHAFVWDSTRELNGTSTLVVRAYDRAGNATDGAPVAVSVANDGIAHLDASLGVPHCETAAPACDSVDLLRGRADVGPELNAPNTLEVACPTASNPDAVCRCADGPFGQYELDESIEQITVATLSGGDLAVGADVQVDVTLYVGSTFYDALDLFSSPTVIDPAWRHLGTLQAAASGLQTLSARFTLPEGENQAIRASLRYGSTAATCTEGGFDDRDDLTFVVAEGTPDTAAPSGVAITAPVAGAEVSGSITVAASATDDHLLSRVDFLVGSTLVGSAFSSPYSVEWNSGLVPNGTYALQAIAWDGAGNVAQSAPVEVLVKDEMPPVVAIASPLDGAQLETTTIPVEVTAADEGVVSRVELWVDDAFYGADVSAPYEVTWTAGQGSYRLVARAFDGAGNAGESAPVTVSLGDAVAPTCAIREPADLATVVGTVLLQADAADDKGLASVQFFRLDDPDPLEKLTVTSAPWFIPWETGRLPNGTYTLYCVARDAANNPSPETPTITVTVADVADPTVTIVSPPVTRSTEGSVIPTPVSGVYRLEASAGDDGAVERVEFYLDDEASPLGTAFAEPYVITWNSGSVLNGPHSITAKAWDFNGHSAVGEVVSIFAGDTAPPAVTMRFPLQDATLGGTVPIRVEVSDPGGEVAKVELFDGDVLVEELVPGVSPGAYEGAWATDGALPGEHTLTVKATDLNGLEGTASVQVTVAPNGATFDATFAAPACLADATSCHSSWLLDGRGRLGPEANAPNTVPGSAGGPCADGANGDYHSDESIDFVAVRSVSGATLTAGAAAEVEVRAWVFDPMEDRVEVFVASNASAPEWIRLPPPKLGGTPGRQVLTVPYTLPNGAIQAVRASIRYAAADTDTGACVAGDYNDHDDLVFAVAAGTDGAPPNVAIVDPADGASVSGEVTIAVHADDDVAIAMVEFLVDGEVAETIDAAPYEWIWDTIGLPSAPHVLTARATDYSGKTTESAPVTVTVLDQSAPAIALTAPLGRETVVGTVTIAATADDAVGVAKVEFFVGGTLVGTDTTSPYAVSWNSASRGDGLVTVKARGYDESGNSSDSESLSIVVSNTGNARYDNTWKAPACGSAASKCFSGALVNGRGPLGPEPNAPNTLGASCGDGIQGSYHVDESIDAITIRSPTGTLTAGGTAIVEVKLWAGRSSGMDALDLYVTADPAAVSPEWTRIATLTPTQPGAQILSTSYTLPSGAVQAVRAQLRYAGDATIVCGAGTFDDRDDLVFAINP